MKWRTNGDFMGINGDLLGLKSCVFEKIMGIHRVTLRGGLANINVDFI